jgi:hypothetical protein
VTMHGLPLPQLLLIFAAGIFLYGVTRLRH